VTFWDGEPLTADIVVESIERNWEEQPASRTFLPAETEIEVLDDLTLQLTLPEPDSALPHNLAVPQLVIHRMVDDQAIMTGPYRPVALRADDDLELQAHDDYWGGLPPIQQITVRRVSDGSARELAVQSGDADVMTEASPEAAAAVSGDVASVAVESTRIHYVILNHERAPFDDPAVREAVNLAIDRDELNQIALGGLGTPTTTLLPPELGIDTPDQLEIDLDLAAEVLDEAGWLLDDNGIRQRDGEPLQFEVLTYPGRPELTPMAVSIQEQLGRIGIEVSVQEVDDITGAIDGTGFQASIYSMNMLPNGDPAYALDLVGAADGGSNYGNYQRDEYDALLREIRVVETEEERAELIRSAQQMLLDDHVSIFLMAAPRAVVYRADRFEEPELHPSEMYFIHLDTPQPLN
jgi:peptide/nickel transport system substrate-binding protein